jgi:hypothetical protein
VFPPVAAPGEKTSAIATPKAFASRRPAGFDFDVASWDGKIAVNPGGLGAKPPLRGDLVF